MRQYTVFQTDNPVIYANYDITDSTIDSVHSEELPTNRTRQLRIILIKVNTAILNEIQNGYLRTKISLTIMR